ncbi:hypothetical protein J1N35_034866 [Gossypium stocksii]|uniref:MADS-box domain-containing protein n=1 Tax=Gossypium stocksii TaxID=47602 RepID=A0A9D3UT63_9ROSI|nr:hypothetical protein J1N35_034866 [Gossypium stocksii]
MKKVMELPTMCGVEGGLKVYCPYEQEPMVWPSHEEVQNLLKKFYQFLKMEHNKKSMKLETYYKEKASKLQDQLKKQTRKANEVKDWLKDNINAKDIRGKARSKIQSEIGLTYHDPLIATIGDDLRFSRSSLGDTGSSTPRVPMPPFGHDSSSSVLIASLELPTFGTFSEALLIYDNSAHCPLEPVESNSLASDFLGNLLKFWWCKQESWHHRQL